MYIFQFILGKSVYKQNMICTNIWWHESICIWFEDKQLGSHLQKQQNRIISVIELIYLIYIYINISIYTQCIIVNPKPNP